MARVKAVTASVVAGYMLALAAWACPVVLALY